MKTNNAFQPRIVIAIVAFIVGVGSSAVAAQKLYQDRSYEPVVLRGEILSSFYDVPINEIFMYAYHDSTQTWVMIPFQIDEMEFGEDPFSPGAYQDFYFLPDDGLLDLRDELVFMVRDLGDEAPNSAWIENEESKNYPRLEIKIADPNDLNNRACGYLFRLSTITEEIPSPYGFSFDPINQIAGNNYYSVRLSKANGLIEDVIIKPPFGSGVDIFDTQKIRFVGVFELGYLTLPIGKNGAPAANERDNLYVFNENDTEDYHLYYTPKPIVRLIREVRQTICFNPIVFRETAFYVKTKFYPFSGSIGGGADLDPETLKKEFNMTEDIYVRLDLLRQSWDFNANAAGMYFLNHRNQDVLIDGEADQLTKAVNVPIREWTLTTGEPGSMFSYMEFNDTSWQQVELYYHDSKAGGQGDDTFIEGGDTGDSVSFGDQGILFRNLANDSVSLKLNFTAYFLPKNLAKADGEKLAYSLENPVKATSQSQTYSIQAVEIANFGAPKSFALYQNYPNPFNSSTVISFALPAKQSVVLQIYDSNGRVVAKLAEGLFKMGTYYLRWDGRDDRNRSVASGVYFCRFQTEDFSSVKKLILLR